MFKCFSSSIEHKRFLVCYSVDFQLGKAFEGMKTTSCPNIWLFPAGPCPYNIIRNIKIKWTHLYNHFTVDCMVQVWIITMSTLCKLKIFQWFRDVPSPMTLVRTSGLSEISPDSRVQNQSTFPRQIFMSELNPRISRFLKYQTYVT